MNTNDFSRYIHVASLPLAVDYLPSHFAISVPEVACTWRMQDLDACSVLLQQLLQAEGYKWDDEDTPAGTEYPEARYFYLQDGAVNWGTSYHIYLANVQDFNHTAICMDYLSETYVRKYLESRAEYVQE